MKLYMISGMGADEKVFRFLRLRNAELHVIHWREVDMNESLQSYAQRLAADVDTSAPFALGGLSLGGVCAQEMTRFLNPEKLILISTIKSRSEMPPLLRMAASTRLQKIIPEQFYKWAAVHSGAVIGVREVEDKAVFQKMLNQYGEDYYYWSIKALAEWQGTGPDLPYLHLHGDQDRVFPVRFIKNAEVIAGGTHYMIVNKARQISARIDEFLASSHGE